ncbi:MAG: RsmD family RNA methyltransferase, partial [Candidatus Cloacimonetes bacterium]|nr:RsmD family RNA methyltransferase [Candidatus Cloacimonadota bacterium]
SALFANIEILQCIDKCKIIKKKVEIFLTKPPSQKFDLIFLDPPYNKDLVNNTLNLLYQNSFVKEDGLIIVERSKAEIISRNFEKFIIKEKLSGPTAITFLKAGNL